MLESAISIFDADRFIPIKPRIKLIDGDIEQSVPAFVRDNPGVRFSLVHFDCDLYRPTKIALEALWPHVSRGGVILFDEYAIADWPGETAAVDEFLADKPEVRAAHLFLDERPREPSSSSPDGSTRSLPSSAGVRIGDFVPHPGRPRTAR